MAAEQIGKSSLKVATLTLLGGCMIFAGATHAIAQERSPSIAQVVALDECDPVTFNATPAAGAVPSFAETSRLEC